MRILLTTILAFNILIANAQTAPDFTITDIDGNSRNLYNTLDAGNVVVLKFFTNWCGICNNTADEVLALYNSYQSNGDPVVFWALDRDPNETNAHATTYRDNHNLTFPVIGEASSVAALYGVQYQPEYRIICPDRSYEEEVSYTQVDQHVQTCLSQITGIEEAVADGKLYYEQRSTGLSVLWKTEADETAKLTMIDMSGRIAEEHLISGGERVTFRNLTPGIYISVFEQNGTHVKDKIAVTR